MKYKTVQLKGGNSYATVPVKSWYQRPATWISLIMMIVGIIGVISQNFPQWAAIGATVAGVLQLVAQGIENVISTNSQ